MGRRRHRDSQSQSIGRERRHRDRRRRQGGLARVFEGQKSFGVVARFPAWQRDDIEPIKSVLINAPSGARLPLGQLAHVLLKEGPAQISRENAQRRIVIECNDGQESGYGSDTAAKPRIQTSSECD